MPAPSPSDLPPPAVLGVPFESTEEAWFWFIDARAAQIDGAVRHSRPGAQPRPCEPVDILNILNRLYRDRRMTIEHLRVLKHYGDRHTPPTPARPSERAAAALWDQAIERLTECFIRHGIVSPPAAWWSAHEPDTRTATINPPPPKRTKRTPHRSRLGKKLSTRGGHRAV